VSKTTRLSLNYISIRRRWHASRYAASGLSARPAVAGRAWTFGASGDIDFDRRSGMHLFQRDETRRQNIAVEHIGQRARPGRMKRFPGPSFAQRAMKVIEQGHFTILQWSVAAWLHYTFKKCVSGSAFSNIG
jgi:hypothetical protein